MKVEVELSEIESLKKEIKEYKENNAKLQEKLKSLSEDELKKKAVSLSWRLFNDYLAATFKHLGFDKDLDNAVVCNEDLTHWLGKRWYDSPRIHFELNAAITANFRSAFLKLRILANDENEKKDDYDL